MALLPSLCAALDLWPQEIAPAQPGGREAVLPMAVAAATAAGRSGTEVASATDGAGGRRWALVKQRLRFALPAAPVLGAETSASSHPEPDDARPTWE
jgi:hypothetical protein